MKNMLFILDSDSNITFGEYYIGIYCPIADSDFSIVVDDDIGHVLSNDSNQVSKDTQECEFCLKQIPIISFVMHSLQCKKKIGFVKIARDQYLLMIKINIWI